MNYKISYIILMIGLIIGVVIAVFGAYLAQSKPIAVVGVVIIIASVIQAGCFYRCPHCKKPFNIRGGKPKHCPECGEKIDW